MHCTGNTADASDEHPTQGKPDAATAPPKPVIGVRRVLIWPFVAVIFAYRATLSPFVGRQCRFHPTCSLYALDAYRRHGAWIGTTLTFKRVLRCHPFSRGGYDPVPIDRPERTKGRSSPTVRLADDGMAHPSLHDPRTVEGPSS